MNIMSLRSPRIWPWIALLLLIFMLVINVQVLRPWTKRDVNDGFSQLCEQSEMVSIDGHASLANLSSRTFQQDVQGTLRTNLLKVAGNKRSTKGFLTIGIPSIKRINGAAYLIQTLSSLVEHTSAVEQESIVVIVFLADFDADYNRETLRSIHETFPGQVKKGFILILTVSRDFYPPLEHLKRNFNDEPARVSWRAKQVIDFALMFSYARNISDYYVQIEDDVTCAKNYFSAIRDYVGLRVRESERSGKPGETTAKHWAMLEFSELGFIGKLFRSSDLDKLSRYMVMFYEEQPVDWLMNYFRLSMGQRTVFLRKPTLFQHIGLKSSFDLTKDNPLKDRYFDSGSKTITGDNPPAVVLSPMPCHKDHVVDMAYSSGSGYFWATHVSVGDAIYVIFEEAVVLKRIVVLTGSSAAPDDKLMSGSVFIGTSVASVNVQTQSAVCDGLVPVGTFINGTADAQDLTERVSAATACVVIRSDESLEHWVVFSQIAVFVDK